MRAAALLLALVLASSCLGSVRQLDRNAPWHTDVREPPAQMVEPIPDVPDRDPGEYLAVFALAPAIGFGYGEPADGSGTGLTRLDVEASAELRSYDRTRSHRVGPVSALYEPARQNLGLRLGGTVAESEWDPEGRRALYAEIDWEAPIALLPRFGVGWSVEPTTGDAGPRATLTLLRVLHVRGNYTFGERASITAGYSVPFYYILAWSR